MGGINVHNFRAGRWGEMDILNLLQAIIGSLELVQTRIARGRTNEIDRFVLSRLLPTLSLSLPAHCPMLRPVRLPGQLRGCG